jgi:hypothetical protein
MGTLLMNYSEYFQWAMANHPVQYLTSIGCLVIIIGVYVGSQFKKRKHNN